MGNEKPPEKIGIGPLGRGGGLIQFIVFAVVGIVIFVYCISPATYCSENHPCHTHYAHCPRPFGAFG